MKIRRTLRYNLLAYLIFIPTLIHSSIKIKTVEIVQPIKESKEIQIYQKIPNLDTLANYILTQSKTDSVDINCIVQVMLNRFNRSNYSHFSTMLYSNSSYGSNTVKNGKSSYWFSKKGRKYLPRVKKEILKVLNGITYEDMTNVYYFSNHKCTYHSSNPVYIKHSETKKHQYFYQFDKKS